MIMDSDSPIIDTSNVTGSRNSPGGFEINLSEESPCNKALGAPWLLSLFAVFISFFLAFTTTSFPTFSFEHNMHRQSIGEEGGGGENGSCKTL